MAKLKKDDDDDDIETIESRAGGNKTKQYTKRIVERRGGVIETKPFNKSMMKRNKLVLMKRSGTARQRDCTKDARSDDEEVEKRGCGTVSTRETSIVVIKQVTE